MRFAGRYGARDRWSGFEVVSRGEPRLWPQADERRVYLAIHEILDPRLHTMIGTV